jgi:hypothetical protein
VIVAVVIVAVAAGVVLYERGEFRVASSGSAAATPGADIPATVSSMDPSGGSGFRPDGGNAWRTQTYQSATFGNLKAGVGLLLDAGTPRAVGAVTFDVVGGPLAVELRAADTRAGSQTSYSRITGADAASGPTRLVVTGGAKHRYWLIWVTRLAPADGGYRAVLRHPAVKAPSS